MSTVTRNAPVLQAACRLSLYSCAGLERANLVSLVLHCQNCLMLCIHQRAGQHAQLPLPGQRLSCRESCVRIPEAPRLQTTC